MPATYIHDGDALDHIPTTDLPCGAVVVLGSMVGIAHRPIPANALGSLAIEGIWDLPVLPGGATTVGSPVFWEPGPQMATTDPAQAHFGLRCGTLVRPLAAGDVTARVLLNR
jgi:predicted RecA/RadA family phage recombinase